MFALPLYHKCKQVQKIVDTSGMAVSKSIGRMAVPKSTGTRIDTQYNQASLLHFFARLYFLLAAKNDVVGMASHISYQPNISLFLHF